MWQFELIPSSCSGRLQGQALAATAARLPVYPLVWELKRASLQCHVQGSLYPPQPGRICQVWSTRGLSRGAAFSQPHTLSLAFRGQEYWVTTSPADLSLTPPHGSNSPDW